MVVTVVEGGFREHTQLFSGVPFSVPMIFAIFACCTPVVKKVTEADGNVYTTVKIGNQIWTVEDLKTTRLLEERYGGRLVACLASFPLL